MDRPQMVGLGLAIAAAVLGTLGLLDSERLPSKEKSSPPAVRDADHDGRISQAEWTQAGGALEQLRSADANGDGFLDPVEVSTLRGSGRKD